MKTLYFECNMGAAGDMLMASLLELCEKPDEFMKKMNSLGLENVLVKSEVSSKCAINGTHVSVIIDGEEEESHDHHHECHHEHDHHHECHHEHEHEHSSMQNIEHILSHMNVDEKVKKDVLAVYNLIAKAESHAHGKPVEQIHFHELGNIDAIVDITGVCMLINELNVDKILCSPINVGSGQVRCAHGVLPVPVPAVAHVLTGVPIYSGKVKAELCTPTGAALLKYFASDFCEMPSIKLLKTGYGMGKKDFPEANCVRAILGETDDVNTDLIVELACNIDDMTGEELGFAIEMLWSAGALDVYTSAIQMKKNRPAVILTCICKLEKKEEILKCIFKHTSSLGVREYKIERHILKREIKQVESEFGTINLKNSSGFGTSKSKYEFEDIAKIARENNLSLKEVINKL